MGNPARGDDDARPDGGAAPIARIYTASAWIDGRAEDQLRAVARLPGVVRLAAFPDLHPGRHGPVGCAVLSDTLHPGLVGNDIGCGMALFALDLPARKLKPEKAARRLAALEGEWDGPAGERLEEAGLSGAPAPALGTIGGGNHFCELQVVEETATDAVDATRAHLLVHSGSRGLGTAVLAAAADAGAAGLAAGDEGARAYLAGHDRAVAFAALNRRIVAERAAALLGADLTLLADVPHNLVSPHAGAFLHRKGAAVAAPLVPVAGSRATLSYLVAPGTADTLASLAHGAGRKHDRAAMHGRLRTGKADIARLTRTALGGHVICEDRALLVEEAPEAYKSAERVVADLEALGAARRLAAFRPVVTFKKAREKT